jgi:hypothetical protein
MTPTPSHRLADLLLGEQGPLESFVRSRRSEERAWRLIARDLYEATDKQVDLTYETLRAWFPDEPVTAASSPSPSTAEVGNQ